jgi:hypothetical protein
MGRIAVQVVPATLPTSLDSFTHSGQKVDGPTRMSRSLRNSSEVETAADGGRRYTLLGRGAFGGGGEPRLVAVGGVVLDQALFGGLVDLGESA